MTPSEETNRRSKAEKRRRERLKAEGLCTRCRERMDRTGAVCEKCRQLQLDRDKRVREMREERLAEKGNQMAKQPVSSLQGDSHLFDDGLTASDGNRTDFYLVENGSDRFDIHIVTGNADLSFVDNSEDDLIRLGRWIERVVERRARARKMLREKASGEKPAEEAGL